MAVPAAGSSVPEWTEHRVLDLQLCRRGIIWEPGLLGSISAHLKGTWQSG